MSHAMRWRHTLGEVGLEKGQVRSAVRGDENHSAKELGRDEGVIVAFTSTFRKYAALTPSEGVAVIEIGSSFGVASLILAQAVGKDKFIGFDNSREMVEACRSDPKLEGIVFERLDVLLTPKMLLDTASKLLTETGCKRLLITLDIGGDREVSTLK